jgi:hypothetical protein
MVIREVKVGVWCTMSTTRIVVSVDFGDQKHTPTCYILTTFFKHLPDYERTSAFFFLPSSTVAYRGGFNPPPPKFRSFDKSNRIGN